MGGGLSAEEKRHAQAMFNRLDLDGANLISLENIQVNAVAQCILRVKK